MGKSKVAGTPAAVVMVTTMPENRGMCWSGSKAWRTPCTKTLWVVSDWKPPAHRSASLLREVGTVATKNHIRDPFDGNLE